MYGHCDLVRRISCYHSSLVRTNHLLSEFAHFGATIISEGFNTITTVLFEPTVRFLSAYIAAALFPEVGYVFTLIV